MAKIHIGKKIRQVLDNSPFKIVAFAKKINLTRDGVYKIFEKETIATHQLQKISEVLNHDFFSYYQTELNLVSDNTANYGFAAKEDVENLAKLVKSLAKDIEKMREEMKPAKALPKNSKKRPLTKR
jgi:hypothetical protein